MEFLKSAPGADPLIVEGVFAAPVERVFQAWTNPDDLVQWFGRAPGSVERFEVDLRVGGAWRCAMRKSDDKAHQLQGEYLEIDRNKRLVFTWTHIVTADDGSRETTPVSQVTISFEPNGAARRLTLRHEAIRTEDARHAVGGGWTACFRRLSERFGVPD